MPNIKICTSIAELERLQPLWQAVAAETRATMFQDFHWNLMAARAFSASEAIFVVSAEASHGAAIVPTARRSDGSLRLLGEELFDYRNFLSCGDDGALCAVLAFLSQMESPLEVLAVRECDRRPIMDQFSLESFSCAPGVGVHEVSAEAFAAAHNRLGRNLRRLNKAGFELGIYSGENSALVSHIYEQKAAQVDQSLFQDRRRVGFMIDVARLDSFPCEIFTLECGVRMAAAIVTFLDGEVRRFYTGWFSREFESLSPAITLIYEVTRQSLACGLSCDYMTGEQPYKLRLARTSVPLYRMRATPRQLAAVAEGVEPAAESAA
ncbi:MAG TPA: GNAT family N-acetyltransferase [Candidatus Angelobacter sp.]|nr:GNAT family N-acetyltransferase [Candidatus Angelobacter sp.]